MRPVQAASGGGSRLRMSVLDMHFCSARPSNKATQPPRPQPRRAQTHPRLRLGNSSPAGYCIQFPLAQATPAAGPSTRWSWKVWRAAPVRFARERWSSVPAKHTRSPALTGSGSKLPRARGRPCQPAQQGAREGWERAGAYPASRRLCSDAAHHSAHPPGILLFHSRARKPALRGEASLRPRATRVTAAATAQRPARA
jgi:hypothetical protein